MGSIKNNSPRKIAAVVSHAGRTPTPRRFDATVTFYTSTNSRASASSAASG